MTDPGIIPSIRNLPRVPREFRESLQKINGVMPFYVTYKDIHELEETFRQQGISDNNYVAKYFSNNKFRYHNKEEEDKKKILDQMPCEKLSYCTTCQLMRPPRAFHCNECGCCIEIHDHHCPWVGTCVGYRNGRYFAYFLMCVGIHCLVSAIVCLNTFFILKNMKEELEDKSSLEKDQKKILMLK